MKEMTDTQRSVLKSIDRYKDFTIFDKPQTFSKLYAGQEFSTIKVHSIELIGNDSSIIGFCGVFSWKDDVITPLDGDCYNRNMTIYGCSTYPDGVLNLLVGDDW